MAKFICITQHSSLQSFTGPSGESYTSLRGRSFIVSSEQDIKYFEKNHRFEKEGLVKKIIAKATGKKPKVSVTDEEAEALDEFLEETSMSKKGKEEVKKFYGGLSKVTQEYLAGNQFEELPKTQAKKLIKALESRED